MMKKNMRLVIVLMALFITINNVWADDISVEQALQIARQFRVNNTQARPRVKSSNNVVPSLTYVVRSKTSQKDNVYVINLGNDQGFVIVAGDDGADEQILGYCDHGTFDYDKAPIQLHDILDNYSAGIDALRESDTTKKAAVRKTINYALGEIIVEPLITTTWDQWAPYNYLCPEGCPTGCVPTALAQIMNYWKHPLMSRGTLRSNSQDFSGHTYDWDNMLDNYKSGKYTPEQAQAVAKLMADIGQAAETAYKTNESSTSIGHINVWPMFANFGFSPKSSFVSAKSPEQLVDVLKQELNQKRPVFYVASPDSKDPDDPPHALVVDGYSQHNYFHFNYGWGGECDGFYLNAVCDIYNVSPQILVGLCPYESKVLVQDDISYVLLPDGTAEVSGYMSSNIKDIDLTIPNTVTDSDGKEYKVVRILYSLLNKPFCSFSRLQIGDNVTEIAPSLFNSCTIDKLIFSDGIKTISGMQSFTGAIINEMTLGSSLSSIGDGMFIDANIKKIICRSESFTVGADAFAYAQIPDGDWYDHITELGDGAFCGVSFPSEPSFTQLQKIGANAFMHTQGLYGTFQLSDKVKYIDPEAFSGSQLKGITMDKSNPYYSWPNFAVVCNKEETALSFVFPNSGVYLDEGWIPNTVLKFEPRSIPTRGNYSVTIPNAVEDVTGAFSKCESLSALTCLAVVPPAADDNSFNDALFSNPNMVLYVPVGTVELYEKAPGWRRFPRIVGNKPYVMPQMTPGREYYMIVHCSGADGQTLSKRMPVSKVKDIRVGDYISTDGPTLTIAAEGETNTLKVDSITWMKGFVFGQSEVFDIDPDHLEAKATCCTVRLGATVIDGPVQLSVRQAVSATGICENVAREMAVDISLSNGMHELTGTAEIEFPVEMNEGEHLMAAYYDEETGEWTPVLCTYDQETKTARILTDHFSLFEIFFRIEKADSRKQFLQSEDIYLTDYIAYQTFDEAIKKILEIMTSDDPDAEAIRKWKEDYSFWQTVGLDGGYNLLSGIGFSQANVDKAVSIVGWLGTALTFLDVVAADIKGDNLGVAVNSLKTINSIAGAYASAAVGTTALSLCSGITAFIGIALEKLGTKVQEAKLDYARAMYRYYYSPEGANECGSQSRFGTNYYRTTTDWFNVLYPAIEKGMSSTNFQAYVEQMVRRYCDQFWEEYNDVQFICESEAKSLGFSSSQYIDESLQQQVCDEYFAELINGPITSVMQNIKNKLAVKQKEEYDKRVKDYVRMMNTGIGFRFSDSSCSEGEISKFEGCKVRFATPPTDVTDPNDWECTIDENGKGQMGCFSIFALTSNNIKPQLVLLDKYGDEMNAYDYVIDSDKSRVIFDFDLAQDGKSVIAKKNFQLSYNPQKIDLSIGCDYFYTYIALVYGKETTVLEHDTMDLWIPMCIDYETNHVGQPDIPLDDGGIIPANDWGPIKNTRFETEIEKFFGQLETIDFRYGTVKIGDNITGDWNEDTQEGAGKFTIHTTYPFVENTKAEFIRCWNNAHSDDKITLLNGTMKHDIDCQFTIRRFDDSCYEMTVIGEGDFRIEGEKISWLKNLDGDSVKICHGEGFTLNMSWCILENPDDVVTSNFSDQGTVKLNYTKKISTK